MFSAAVERALRAAERAHREQRRKGSDAVPYVLHPIHCALLLARLGFQDDVLVSALLHDVVEDCPEWTIRRIEAEFGTTVARIVGELTEDKSKSWEERKRAQVEHAPTMTPEALAVKAADKLHNLRTLAADLRDADDPRSVWSRFRAGECRTVEFSRALVDQLVPRVDPRLGAELARSMAELESLVTRKGRLPGDPDRG